MFQAKSLGFLSKRINQQKNLNYLVNRNFIKFSYSTKSHLELMAERDREYLLKLKTESNFTQEDIGEFARVLKKHGGDADLFKKFEVELLKNLNNLTELELRKVISLIISEKNRGYLRSDAIVDILSEKLDLIYTPKDRCGISLEEFKSNKRNFLRNEPAAHKFWIYLYSLRVKSLNCFKNFGIFAK